MMQMPQPRSGQEGRASGKRFDRWEALALEKFQRYVQNGVAILLQDGYPPGAEPNTPEGQRVQLTAWKVAGDPRYTNNPRAQEALDDLDAQYSRTHRLQPPRDGVQPMQPPSTGA